MTLQQSSSSVLLLSTIDQLFQNSFEVLNLSIVSQYQTLYMSEQEASSASHPERSLNRQVVLEEDEYTEALSRIIARDFFPSLVHLDATNEYLDALKTRDPHLINASVRRLEDLNFTPAGLERRHRRMVAQTPSQTPFGLATDTPTRSVYGEPPTKRVKYDSDMSLDEFQARYTSEDNSSFTKILDEENRVRKEKWEWAWDAQRRVEAGHAKMIQQRKTMLIEPAPVTGVREKFVIEPPKPLAGLIGAAKESEEQRQANVEDNNSSDKAVVKSVTGTENELDVMAPQKDRRQAGVDGWNFKARNSFMFPPDADVSPYQPPAKVLVAEHDPRDVNYTSTRLPEQEHSTGNAGSVSAPPSPTRSRIDAAISGTPYRPRSPQDQTFGLVPNIPSPTPAELGPAALKQLMTWGTLNSTPRIISQTDNPTTPFHLPAISAREATAHRLADNASKSLRAKANMFDPNKASRSGKPPLLAGKGSMAPPTMTPRRAEAAGNLTPAARRLLHRTTLGTAASRRAEAMEQNARWDLGSKGKERELNKVRWTPTPTPVHRR